MNSNLLQLHPKHWISPNPARSHWKVLNRRHPKKAPPECHNLKLNIPRKKKNHHRRPINQRQLLPLALDICIYSFYTNPNNSRKFGSLLFLKII